MTTGSHKEGEIHNEKEFLKYYGEAEGETKWKEAADLEERRYDSGRRKMYTIGQWERAFSGMDKFWKRKWKRAEVAPPLNKAIKAPLAAPEATAEADAPESTVVAPEADAPESTAEADKADKGDGEVQMDAVEEADKEEQRKQDEAETDAEKKQAVEEAKVAKKQKEAEEKTTAEEKIETETEEASTTEKGAEQDEVPATPPQEAAPEEAKDEASENADNTEPQDQEDPDELEQDEGDSPNLDIPKPGSQKWSSCESHNAHKCVDMKHCCCNVGTTYDKQKQICEKSKQGDQDPEVISRQIPRSRARARFGTCKFERGMHPCGTGCCCNRELEYNVDSQNCEESPAQTGAKPSDLSMSDPAPPKEDPIPGSQTWTQTGASCESKEAYGCGAGRSHCCCRFGCEFIEMWDSCGKCQNDVPKVKQNMIPASQLWESRVKKGICNARRSHPCGAGCCCNGGYTWSKEQRKCQSDSPEEEEPAPAPAPAAAAAPEAAGPKQGGGNGGSVRADLAMALLLLPLLWTRC